MDFALNLYSVTFFIINAIALLFLPRRKAFVPIIIGTCYMTMAQGLTIGPFSFTFIRMIIAVGVVRLLIRREFVFNQMNGLDRLMLVWAVWALCSGLFRIDIWSAFVFRLGLVYNVCGTYFLFRSFCQTFDDMRTILIVLAILLLPIAIEMLLEHLLKYNYFSILGGVSNIPDVRDGNIRAQGPFRHAILAGTVGAVCFPMIIGIWNKHRKVALAGLISCLAIVIFSSSSGPIASLIAGIVGLYLWRFRQNMKAVRWIAISSYITLEIIMKAPAYYLMGRIPIIAASTGWHRAELINSALIHINEWWLYGTDYTRHWMPTGIHWSPNHTDITNHYIKMGVWGGLPLMILFIIIILKAFSFVGQLTKHTDFIKQHNKFIVWTLGASLFANAATMISVSYFDQSFVYLYLTLAAISSMWSFVMLKEDEK